MLCYQEAIEKIVENALPLRARRVPLQESLGLMAAHDMISPEPFPCFDHSAVDGYAVPQIIPSGDSMKVQGEVRAGEIFKRRLRAAHAIQIFTGAPVPRGTWAVAMQEDTERINGTVQLLKFPRRGENIRFRGEDFQKGRILVRKRTLLQPAHLSVLAAVGYKKILVHPFPKIAILATGSELSKGGRLRRGKIRDSNTILLESLVRKMGGNPLTLPSVGDHPSEIRSAIQKGLQSDLLLISGGVSVGKYDFVKEALKKAGVKEIFWKVNIKPGKPIFFGKKKHTLVFGLPGNPVSVFVTFEEFVKPAIERIWGRPRIEEKKVQGYLTHGFRNGKRLHFVRVRCTQGKRGYAITPLSGQGSHQIGELALANALLRVEPGECLRKGRCVSVKRINQVHS